MIDTHTKSATEIALCKSCDLWTNSRVNCLKGQGPVGAELMFIGDGPRETDEETGRPFTGQAGEVFDYLLLNAGINRSASRVSNIVACRPVDFNKSRKDGRGNVHYGNLTPTVLQSYVCGTKHLEDEIRAVKPKVIVAMGNVACEYLFGKHLLLPDGTMKMNKKGDKPAIVNHISKITDLMYAEYFDPARNLYLVPMFHPEYLIHSTDYFMMMVELLKKAELIAKNGPGQDVTECFIATNYDDALSVIRRAKEYKTLSYDHETDSLDWRFGPLLNTGFSWKEGTGASIRWADNKGVSLYSQDQKSILIHELKSIFQNPDKILVGYNVPFDASWTEAKLGLRVTTPQHDVQSMYHTLNSTATHKKQSLEILSWLYTSMANFKDSTSEWFDKHKFVECPIPVMSTRNCGDTDATLRLYNRFYPRLQASPTFAHYERLIKHLPLVATTLHVNGANIGLDKLRVMRDRLEEASRDLVSEFCAGAGVELFNLRSRPKLAEVLHVKLGLPILERTPTGKPKTSADVLEQLGKNNPILKPLMEYNKLQKLLGTYVLGLRSFALFGKKRLKPDIWSVAEARSLGFTTDGRVHPSFSVVGTVTGRPSVSRPNTANQPRPTQQQRDLGVVLRQAFTAPDGWNIYEIDLSQAELRVLAALSGDNVLSEAVNSKEGAHRITAADMYKVPLDKVTEEQKSAGKKLNFTIGYGGTKYVVESDIADELDAELKRRDPVKYLTDGPTKEDRMELAQEFINAWHGKYRLASKWLDDNKEAVKKKGYAQSIFGRVFHFPLVFSNNYAIQEECARQASNYVIQGPTSDWTFMAGIAVQKEIESLGLKTKWVNMTYDSLAYEVPDSELAAIAKLTKTEMERFIPELGISLLSEAEFGKCWKADKEELVPVDASEVEDEFEDEFEEEFESKDDE